MVPIFYTPLLVLCVCVCSHRLPYFLAFWSHANVYEYHIIVLVSILQINNISHHSMFLFIPFEERSIQVLSPFFSFCCQSFFFIYFGFYRLTMNFISYIYVYTYISYIFFSFYGLSYQSINNLFPLIFFNFIKYNLLFV